MFGQSDYSIQIADINSYLMANSADPDQKPTDLDLQCTLFAKAGHIRVQQDKG